MFKHLMNGLVLDESHGDGNIKYREWLSGANNNVSENRSICRSLNIHQYGVRADTTPPVRANRKRSHRDVASRSRNTRR